MQLLIQEKSTDVCKTSVLFFHFIGRTWNGTSRKIHLPSPRCSRKKIRSSEKSWKKVHWNVKTAQKNCLGENSAAGCFPGCLRPRWILPPTKNSHAPHHRYRAYCQGNTTRLRFACKRPPLPAYQFLYSIWQT